MSVCQYNRWDICLAFVSFEDLECEKIRPVVVLNHTTVLDCLKATSAKPRNNYKGEYTLKDWMKAGLDKETTVRVSKRLSLPNSKIIKKIGTLSLYDALQIEKLIESLYRQ